MQWERQQQEEDLKVKEAELMRGNPLINNPTSFNVKRRRDMQFSMTNYSHSCLQLGIQFFRDVRAFIEANNDVILICTSILSFSKVLSSLPLSCLRRPKTLFVDVLSVKEHPRDLLLHLLLQNL
ncbi:arogenate dehydrogenase 1, chloroplastic-like [Vicia villosa]|uniref:arogenate dehydrogenase 1, chloroplastic-like n=1 Tax=Vicia villosa TaxID=3911 RepID=UPI00273BF6C8|nr:arogenate dehydrogenase 1, chloroplastic-like [Vicia villosa]